MLRFCLVWCWLVWLGLRNQWIGNWGNLLNDVGLPDQDQSNRLMFSAGSSDPKKSSP